MVHLGPISPKRVRVRVSWDVSAADFDLYVYQGRYISDFVGLVFDPEEVFAAGNVGTLYDSDCAVCSGGAELQRDGSLCKIFPRHRRRRRQDRARRDSKITFPTAYNGANHQSVATGKTGTRCIWRHSTALSASALNDCFILRRKTPGRIPTCLRQRRSIRSCLQDHKRASGNTTPDRTFVSQLTGQDSITSTRMIRSDVFTESGWRRSFQGLTINDRRWSVNRIQRHRRTASNLPERGLLCSQEAATAFCGRSDGRRHYLRPGSAIYNLHAMHGHSRARESWTRWNCLCAKPAVCGGRLLP